MINNQKREDIAWQDITLDAKKVKQEAKDRAKEAYRRYKEMPGEDFRRIQKKYGLTTEKMSELLNTLKEQAGIEDDELNDSSNEKEVLLKSTFGENTKKGRYELAKHLVEKHRFVATGATRMEIFVYANGKYEATGNKLIEKEVQQILQDQATCYHLKEITGTIQRMTYVDRDDFRVKDLNLVNVRNGILNIETRKLIPHNPDYYFTWQLPVDYDPEAGCPEFKKFLDQVVSPEDIPLMQEWFGFGLHRSY